MRPHHWRQSDAVGWLVMDCSGSGSSAGLTKKAKIWAAVGGKGGHIVEAEAAAAATGPRTVI